MNPTPEPTPSDTPIMDRIAFDRDWCDLGPLPNEYRPDGDYVSPDDARTLERAARRLADALADMESPTLPLTTKGRAALAEWRKLEAAK